MTINNDSVCWFCKSAIGKKVVLLSGLAPTFTAAILQLSQIVLCVDAQIFFSRSV